MTRNGVSKESRTISGWTTWATPVALGLTSFALLWWTWGKWPDVIIDFGRELYVPWRLSEGEVLYRDIAAFYGPLSQYVNALWFKLFGASLYTLVWCNFALVLLLLYWLHQILVNIGGRVSGFAGCMMFIVLFGFAQYEQIKKFELILNPWTIESGELTPSLKVKRKVISKNYEAQINGMYS